MASLNKCIFIGNLGRDPETAVAKSGVKVTKFSIGVNDKHRDVETTTWISVITFDKLAEIAAQYLHKGNSVCVCGKLQVRQYDRQDGGNGTAVELIANEVIFLEKKRDVADQPPAAQSYSPPASSGFEDDNLPF